MRKMIMRKLFLGSLQFGEGGDGASGNGAAMAGGDAGTGDIGTGDAAGNGAGEGDHAPSQSNGEQKVAKDLKALLKSDPELKAQYDQLMSSAIKRRFQDQEALTKSNEEYKRMAQLLVEAYPDAPQDGSAASMIQYLEGKNDLWAEAAAEQGMSVEAFKKMKSYERQNAALLGEQRAQQEAMRRQQMFESWDAQIPEVQAKYPDFDVQMEANDPTTGQRFTDLLIRRVAVHIEQCLRCEYHAWRAEAALHCADVKKRLLNRVQTAVRTAQSFDRDDGLPFQLVHARNARADGLSVHKHGACAAVAGGAAFLRALQTCDAAEIFEQRDAVRFCRNRLTVQNKVYSNHCRFPFLLDL